MHLSNYCDLIGNLKLVESIKITCKGFLGKLKDNFDFKSHESSLLVGNVQSGKTAHIFGVIASMADEGFELFILLTTDNIRLQEQTFERALSNLETFTVCGENDELRFLASKLKKPTLLVLKKNVRVLQKWRDIVSSSSYCSGRPLVVVDDEGDAASPNTLVNKDDVSKINQSLTDLKNLAPSSFFIQVTATPQALLLQTHDSNWRPKFVDYFKAGDEYIGGDFVYSEPASYCVEFTEEDEAGVILSGEDLVPIGLRRAISTYLLIVAEFKMRGKECCNFLVHPSVKIQDHNSFAQAIAENLNSIFADISNAGTQEELFNIFLEAWTSLQESQPDISPLEDLVASIREILENIEIDVVVLNSKTQKDCDLSKGYKVVVGGNSLGRGITFPALQVVYYCRKAKTPHADTYWQHSRIFGYDRVKGLIRVFMPHSLHNMFCELNTANRLLIKQLVEAGIEGVQLIYSDRIKPTRGCVIDNEELSTVVGGVNYFSTDFESSELTKSIDEILSKYSSDEPHYIVEPDTFLNVLKLFTESGSTDWDGDKYVNCSKALVHKRPTQEFVFIVRRDRDISKDTGTLLSPNDRLLGEKLSNCAVLTLYRLTGSKEKHWGGSPFWVPNIKLPKGICFYDIATTLNESTD